MSGEEIETLGDNPTKETVTKKESKDQSTLKSRKQSVFADRIIEVREKKGVLQAAIPVVPVWLAWICLFFNVFLPGIGKCSFLLCYYLWPVM